MPRPRAATAADLKAQIEAERTGRPFLVYRNQDGEQRLAFVEAGAAELWIGRSSSAQIQLDWDEEVSALHAQLEVVGHECTLVDEGLSRNGSFVNGERVSGQRRLRDEDMLRFGKTVVLYRSPGLPDAKPTAIAAEALTAAGGPGHFRLQLAKAKPGPEKAKIVRQGPKINYQGQDPNWDDPYEVEKFNVNVPVHEGEYLAIKARKTSMVRCSSGGPNQLLFQPALPVGGPFEPADDTDGCWLLLEAIYE